MTPDIVSFLIFFSAHGALVLRDEKISITRTGPVDGFKVVSR